MAKKINYNNIRSFKKSLTIVDLYKSYKYRYLPKSKHHVSSAVYTKIAKKFNLKVSNRIIEEGKIFKLPHRLGLIYIYKYLIKKEKRKIDYKNSKLYGKTIYHDNRHSDGYSAFVKWYKKSKYARFKRKEYSYFSFTRRNSRYLAECIKKKNTIHKYTNTHG